jgi:beta-lactamase superfamily II metal-dependent hydrolase
MSIGSGPTLRVLFLDSGMGDCTLVVFPDNKLMLVDCGAKKNKETVEPQIVAALNRWLPANNGVIDYLVITHPDGDHFNMLGAVLTTTHAKVVDVWYGGDVELYASASDKRWTYNYLTKAKIPSPGVVVGNKPPITVGGVSVRMLACNSSGAPNAYPLKNQNSIVLLLEYCKYKVFLMGDAVDDTEDAIRTKVAPSDLANTWATTLKMGHHGSTTSSSQAWVQALRPNALAISADTRLFNSTGMPKRTQLDSVASWTTLADLAAHDCVEFDDLANPRAFTTRNWTKAVCSTLWRVNAHNRDDASGYSWWLEITALPNQVLVALNPT